MSAQISLYDPLFVDNFAGGGGASTGIEMATGRPVDIAINHDQSAILMHQRNHPYTRHYQDDVWIIDPVKVTGGRPVHIAWFSPDCKHCSRAKGSALCDKNIRGLAWVAVKWAGLVHPDIIMLENVPEFVTWGPLNRSHRPIKAKAGVTFARWKKQLEDLGYVIEYRELCAADYGTPTIRTRFVLIARRDGKSIVWPAPTHAPRNSEAAKSGKLKPWRSAADIIDFSLPCYSIFETKESIKEKYGVTVVRPLRDNTLKRVAKGLDKFVINCAEPFIMCNNAENQPHSLTEPLPTITTGNRNYLVSPFFTQYHGEQSKKDVRGQKLHEPLMTVDSSNRYGYVAPFLTQYFGTGQAQTVDNPLNTVTTKDRENLSVCHLAHFKGQDKGQDLHEPLMTITQAYGQFALIQTKIVVFDEKNNLGYWPQVRKLLNRFCGKSIAENEVLLLNISAEWYYISDIGLRMLTPRELYNAMGFPPDYIIDRDIHGRPISRKDQVARCGNAVCPPLAAAVVRANCPELCPGEIDTMKKLHDVMSA